MSITLQQDLELLSTRVDLKIAREISPQRILLALTKEMDGRCDSQMWWELLNELTPHLVRLSRGSQYLIKNDILYTLEDLHSEVLIATYPVFLDFIGVDMRKITGQHVCFRLLRVASRHIGNLVSKSRRQSNNAETIRTETLAITRKSLGRELVISAPVRKRGQKDMIVEGSRDISGGCALVLTWLGTTGDGLL